jgi:hypothetical protein
MQMPGPGGVGKSTVLHAITAFCDMWNESPSFVITATTGKAAVGVRGCTIHSFLMRCHSSKGKSIFDQLKAIAIDESSMLSQHQLNEVDIGLRVLRSLDISFGGYHVILSGDHLQMPPVTGYPMYSNPKMRHISKLKWEDEKGYELYMKFNQVVYLQENMRFKDDPEWGEGCLLARKGIWTDEFISIVNGRLITSATPVASTTHTSVEEHYDKLLKTVSIPNEGENQQPTVFVTPDNITRTAINSAFIASMANSLPDGQYPIRIRANFHGRLNNTSKTDIEYIMGLPDSSFGRLSPFLDVVIGMPIQITQNLSTGKGVANGSYGILHDIQFPTETKFTQFRDDNMLGSPIVSIPDKAPIIAWIRIDRGHGALPLPEIEGQDDFIGSDLFPVFPQKSFSSKSIKLPSGREVTLHITQLPFINAACSTAYKLQGDTCQSEAVADWKSTDRGKANKPQQGYIILSRPRTRNSIILMRPLTRYLTNEYFRPPQDAIEEDERLLEMHNARYGHLNPCSL